jgi:ribose-phosphate pyrophosphokinase
VTEKLIHGLDNVLPFPAHLDLIRKLGIKTVIFPDAGAFNRYSKSLCGQEAEIRFVTYVKKREPSTGKILGIGRVLDNMRADEDIPKGPCLIVDDICDGGATFLGIEQSMREEGIREGRDLHLFVTHGIFSKGRKVLEDAGIKLWTTNSLPRNQDGIDLERKEA